MIRLITLLFMCFCIISCGPSAEEQAATQKRHDDSIKTETERETRIKFETEEKRKKKVAEYKEMKIRLEQEIINQNSNLVVLKDRLKRDGEFKLGRLASQREAELKRDADNIQYAELNITNLQQKLAEVEKYLSANNL